MADDRYIDFVFTGPPQADIGGMIQVEDQSGNLVDAGSWHHDGVFWRYRVPVELVPRMVIAGDMLTTEELMRATKTRLTRETAPLEDSILSGKALSERLNPAQDKRRALKEKVMNQRQQKEQDQSDWQTCPNCEKKFDPRQDDLQDCSQCGEARCTAICMPNPTQPCLDCEALNAGDEENGREKIADNAQPLSPVPSPDLFSQRLFDGKPPEPKNGRGSAGAADALDADDFDDEGDDD
jgi:hypothetical protein